MKKRRNRLEGFSIRDRFRYWFDNRMSKGSLGLIRGLIGIGCSVIPESQDRMHGHTSICEDADLTGAHIIP